MNPQQNSPPAGSLTPGDIFFILFRHKWKIVVLTIVGLGAGAAILLKPQKPIFESNAKILVRYIADSKSPTDAAMGEIHLPDQQGNRIMNSEIAILTSADCIISSVQAMTPKKVLEAYEGGTNLADAVSIVSKNLSVEVAKESSVINLRVAHADAQIAQQLLDKIIKNYLRKHLEVHRTGNAFEDIQSQTDTIRTRLLETDRDLTMAKTNAGVINLNQAKEDIGVQLSKLKGSLLETEANLAERRAQLNAYRPAAANLPSTASTGVASTNVLASAGQTNTPVAHPVSADDMAKYDLLSRKLASLRAKELDLILSGFAETSSMVKPVREMISESEQMIKALGINPETIGARPTMESPALPQKTFDFESAQAEIQALLAKYQTLTNQFARVRAEAARIEASENRIMELERKRTIEESLYGYYAKSLDQAKVDSLIDSSKLNNIITIEEPTMGTPANDKKRLKAAGGCAAGGLGLALALAFLTELVIDPSAKRTKDVEAAVPVFACIPHFGRNGHSRLKLKENLGIARKEDGWNNGEIAPWEENDPMLSYYEALRDRIVMSYGDDKHKPKVVGLTSCNGGAGGTRLATGVAAALSRDVQRNVLLIALERNKVAISAFFKGKPHAEIPGQNSEERARKLETGHEEVNSITANLQSLVTTGRNLVGASIVQSFCDLMPGLKMSEYDYVIFDLPPITQTSGSIRLASQMERTLLVVEAEKTAKASIKKTKSLLTGTKTQLYAVLNKANSYGPKGMTEA